MNIIGKIKSKLLNIKYRNQIKGNRSIVLDYDHLKIDKSSKLNLNGDLILNANRMGKNGRSSILRMDENSVLDCNGFRDPLNK